MPSRGYLPWNWVPLAMSQIRWRGSRRLPDRREMRNLEPDVRLSGAVFDMDCELLSELADLSASLD